MNEKPIVLSVGSPLAHLVRWPDDARETEFVHATATSQAQAVAMMFELTPSVVVIDLGLVDGSPLAVADFASYRHPDARVIFLSDTAMFSDGSIFAHCANAHAHIARGMAEPDVMALLGYHAAARRPPRKPA